MKKLVSLCLAVVLGLNLFACGGNANTKTAVTNNRSEGTFKIGAIGPITGGAAVYGLAVMHGAQIAVDEINANGGINGTKIEFSFQDDEHDTEKSVNAYNALKDWGMKALVGTVTSAPCIAVSAESANDNMFQITPSGSAVECAAEKNVFRVCFSDPDQGKASAQYIKEHKLGKKIGIIYDSSDVYSSGIRETFVAKAKENGLNVVCEEKFTADSKTDFTTQLKKIKDADADLLFLPFYYNEAALVLKQAKQMGYEPTMFSCDGMDGILTLDNFDTSLAENVMLLTPFSADAKDELTQKFVSTYRERYNETPNQFAADTYDAVYIVKKALEKANCDLNASYSEICDALKVAMTEIKVDGLTGTSMQWDANGEPSKEPKAVKIINGVYVLQ